MTMTVMTITLPAYDDGDGDGASMRRLCLRLIYQVLRQQDNDDDDDDDKKYDNDSNSRLRKLVRTLFKI